MSEIDVSKVPAIVTITNESDKVTQIQFYGTNMWIKLAPKEVLKLLVKVSAELTYYLSLARDGLDVDYDEVMD